MKFSDAELIQIGIGAIQTLLAFWTVLQQSGNPQGKENLLKIGGRHTFWNTISKFDVFAIFISFGCLVLAAALSLPSLVDWAERLARFTLLGMASAVFTLTIIRVQSNKITRQVTYAYENAKVDGGNF